MYFIPKSSFFFFSFISWIFHTQKKCPRMNSKNLSPHSRVSPCFFQKIPLPPFFHSEITTSFFFFCFKYNATGVLQATSFFLLPGVDVHKTRSGEFSTTFASRDHAAALLSRPGDFFEKYTLLPVLLRHRRVVDTISQTLFIGPRKVQRLAG